MRTATMRFWAVVGFATTIVGFAGLPDDFSTWATWINSMVNDPLVLELARHAVAIAGFVNQLWVRAALVLCGILAMIWPLRWFWRLRHKIKFRWRRLLAEKVWVELDTAIDLIKMSNWGRLKEPNVVKSVSTLDLWISSMQRERVVYGMSDTQKALTKYHHFLEQTLESFCEVNPSACRVEDGTQQIEETALRTFLKMAMDDELSDEFGDAPKFKVT